MLSFDIHIILPNHKDVSHKFNLKNKQKNDALKYLFESNVLPFSQACYYRNLHFDQLQTPR